MAADTHETAPTQFVQVGDDRIAYRRFGRRDRLPLLLLNPNTRRSFSSTYGYS
jgi:hypothetical protein